MSVKVENLEKNTANLIIEVEADIFKQAIQNAYNKQKSQIAIPGFRKGKVPLAMVERMYGAEVFYEDAANEVIQAEFPKAVKESGLQVLTARPNVNVDQMKKGENFIFTATVAVYPEVELGEYKGMEVPVNNTEVTDEEVAAKLAEEQEKNSRTVTVDDRAAELGDTVVLDYAGTIDGIAFDGGTAVDHSLTLGSNQFIPGFEAQLVGVATGEEKDVEVTFPEDYTAADLAGKAAVFHCTVHRIEKKELPEIDDEFAQEVSEFDTLDAYKESIIAELKEAKEKQAKNSRRKVAVEKAAALAKIELPDILIREHAEQMTQEFFERLQQQGLDYQQFMQYTGMNVETMIQQNMVQAENDLKNTFVLAKIAEVEGIEVDDERVEKEVAEMAEAYKMDAEQYKQFLPENYAEEIKENLKLNQAADLVGEAAVETEAATKEAEDADKAAAEAIVNQAAEAAEEE